MQASFSVYADDISLTAEKREDLKAHIRKDKEPNEKMEIQVQYEEDQGCKDREDC